MSARLSRAELAAEIEAAIDEFAERVEEERRSLYRTHLRCSVRFASPLLLDLLETEGVSAGDLVDTMQPPPGWPAGMGASQWRPSSRGILARVLKSTRPGLRAPDRRLADCLAYGGALVRAPSHPAGGFGVWTSADMMHAWIDLGGARLAIGGGEGHIALPQLPETLALGMPGRDLDRLLTHPLIDGRGYFVRRVRNDPDGAPVLVFGCGVEPIDLVASGGRS